MKAIVRKRMKEYQKWLDELDSQWERKEQLRKKSIKENEHL